MTQGALKFVLSNNSDVINKQIIFYYTKGFCALQKPLYLI